MLLFKQRSGVDFSIALPYYVEIAKYSAKELAGEFSDEIANLIICILLSKFLNVLFRVLCGITDLYCKSIYVEIDAECCIELPLYFAK